MSNLFCAISPSSFSIWNSIHIPNPSIFFPKCTSREMHCGTTRYDGLHAMDETGIEILKPPSLGGTLLHSRIPCPSDHPLHESNRDSSGSSLRIPPAEPNLSNARIHNESQKLVTAAAAACIEGGIIRTSSLSHDKPRRLLILSSSMSFVGITAYGCIDRFDMDPLRFVKITWHDPKAHYE